MLPWVVVAAVAVVLLVTAVAGKDVGFLEGVVGDEEGDVDDKGFQQGEIRQGRWSSSSLLRTGRRWRGPW